VSSHLTLPPYFLQTCTPAAAEAQLQQQAAVQYQPSNGGANSSSSVGNSSVSGRDSDSGAAGDEEGGGGDTTIGSSSSSNNHLNVAVAVEDSVRRLWDRKDSILEVHKKELKKLYAEMSQHSSAHTLQFLKSQTKSEDSVRTAVDEVVTNSIKQIAEKAAAISAKYRPIWERANNEVGLQFDAARNEVYGDKIFNRRVKEAEDAATQAASVGRYALRLCGLECAEHVSCIIRHVSTSAACWSKSNPSPSLCSTEGLPPNGCAF
jgi:hypothetical protein